MLRKFYLILFLLFTQTLLYGEISVEKKFFIDTAADFNASNIYDNRKNFSKFSDDKNAFGLETSTVWIYVKLTHNSKGIKSNVIEFPYPLLDYIEVLEYEDSQLVESYLTGDLTKFSTRKEDTNTFVIPYNIKENSSKEFIFGIRSKGTLNLKMNFMSRANYTHQAKNSAMILGIYYGAILIMLIYNLILYFMIKEKVYLYYVIFHVFYLFVQLALNGLGFEYFWPNLPEINVYFVFAVMALTNYTAIYFSISFLDIQTLHVRLYKYFMLLKYVTILLFISNFVMPYEFNAKAIALVSIITVSSFFLSSIYILIKDKTLSAKFFVTAWSFMLLGILLTELSFIGLLPANLFTLYSNQIGAILELSLLSIALAYRYNTLFFRLTQREAELRLFNEQLEKTVEERTQIIHSKNSQLSIELKNKNMLLKELFHRVKNNLQIVSSILYTQSKRLKDKEAIEVLNNSLQTINAMGMIHEKLYRSGNLEAINFAEYLDSLILSMKQTLQGNEIDFKIECNNLMITLKNAIPLGLIVNEILTNSIKHAFTKRSSQPKQIGIKLEKSDKDILNLEIFDNGVGIETQNLKKNFGFKLIESLASYQLKADLEYFNSNGLVYKIRFIDNEGEK